MFYILVSRIPYIYNNNDKKDKIFKTFVVGSIAYIIVHGLLYSKKFEDNAIIQKYKKYLMYLALVDLSLTSSLVYIVDKKKEPENAYIEIHKNDSDGDGDSDSDSDEEDELSKKKEECNQPTPSPFINKNEIEDKVVDKKEVKKEEEKKEEEKKEESILETDTELPLYNPEKIE